MDNRDEERRKQMATQAQIPPVQTPPAEPVNASGLRRRQRTSQVYFLIMVIGIWSGLALPPVANGILNLALLIAGAYSMYRVFTGYRVAI